MELDLNAFDFGRQMLATNLDAFSYNFNEMEKISGVAHVGDSGWHTGVTAPTDGIYVTEWNPRNKLISVTALVLAILCAGVWYLIEKRMAYRPA